MNQTSKEWIEFARTDILSCKKLINDDFLTNILAFHSHQAIEKSLKAVIEQFKLKFVKTHDLLVLYEIIEKNIKLDFDYLLLEKLNEVYIESRYPSELGILPYGKPTIVDSSKLFYFAEDLFNKIETALNNIS